MGTRSTVKFYSEHQEDVVLLSVYQQYDGYISGVGHKLANFLKGKKAIGGFSKNRGETMKNGFANGMGCLAAQYVAANKTEIGGFYITTPDDEQEYNYKVKLVDDEFVIEVDEFKGTPDELLNYSENEEEEEF